MAPFKVIRCRYFTEDGKPLFPFCSAGGHCTFLHPKDKGWPGGEPVPTPDVEKRDNRGLERSVNRAPKFLDRVSSFSEGRMSRGHVSSVEDFTSEDSSSRKGSSTSITSVVNTFYDIAKLQNKLTQDKEQADKVVAKLASFRELSESLSKVSAVSAAAVAPTLDAIVKHRNELRAKIEDDMGQLSDLWTAVLNDFLRAICRQFDSELESGTDYLRQEARVLLKSFPKNTSAAHQDVARSHFSPAHSKSPVSGDSSEYATHPTMSSNASGRSLVTNGVSTRDVKGDEQEPVLAVNPPVGISDNGWGRKRRRVSSDSQEHEGQPLNETSHIEMKDMIAKMQLRLEEQSDKIALLIKRNEELNRTVERHSNAIPGVLQDSNALTKGTVSETELRQTLRGDVLALLNPAFEEQKKVNDYWETRFSLMTEKLEKMGIIEAQDDVEEDFTMGTTLQATGLASSSSELTVEREGM